MKVPIAIISKIQIIQTEAFFTDDKIQSIGTAFEIPKEFVFHHWPPQHKDTTIILNHPIINSIVEVLKSDQLVVITLSMKEKHFLNFNKHVSLNSILFSNFFFWLSTFFLINHFFIFFNSFCIF